MSEQTNSKAPRTPARPFFGPRSDSPGVGASIPDPAPTGHPRLRPFVPRAQQRSEAAPGGAEAAESHSPTREPATSAEKDHEPQDSSDDAPSDSNLLDPSDDSHIVAFTDELNARRADGEEVTFEPSSPTVGSSAVGNTVQVVIDALERVARLLRAGDVKLPTARTPDSDEEALALALAAVLRPPAS